MPELHSGMTGDFRAFHASRKVDLGGPLESFIGLAIPDVHHILMLDRLVRAGKDGGTPAALRENVDVPKASASTALNHFEKLGLARAKRNLMSKTYTMVRDGTRADLAIRLVKLWKHPQAHQSVLQAILKAAGGK